MHTGATSQLTALDGIALVVTAAAVLALIAFPFLVGPAFAGMFADLGSTELPPITRLALSTWFPLVLAAAALAPGIAGAAVDTLPIAVRRSAIVLSFVLACAGIATCVLGAYAPIFDLAGSISAE